VSVNLEDLGVPSAAMKLFNRNKRLTDYAACAG